MEDLQQNQQDRENFRVYFYKILEPQFFVGRESLEESYFRQWQAGERPAKQCKRCRKFEGIVTFGKHPWTKDHKQVWCQGCFKEIGAKRSKINENRHYWNKMWCRICRRCRRVLEVRGLGQVGEEYCRECYPDEAVCGSTDKV